MNLLLITSPLGDPTTPYHSTAYLAGNLKKNGFDNFKIRDLNIEFVNWCFEREVFESFSEQAQRHLRELSSKTKLNFSQQEQFYSLWSSPRMTYDNLRAAVDVMRHPERFLDFAAYYEGAQVLRQYINFIGRLSYPGEIIDFQLQGRRRFSWLNMRDLFDPELTRMVCLPFMRFLEECLVHDDLIRSTDCLGISVAYEQQLFYAFQLARWFKTRWPERQILFGGTAISHVYRGMKEKDNLKHFFTIGDGLVIGEGETAICEVADRNFNLKPGAEVRNLITYDSYREQLFLPKEIVYEDLSEIGAPLYDYEWDLYLAPARGVLYSPTRGCYWNRCTFCNYGLSDDSPTSPWRERPAEMVAEELTKECQQQDIRYVYFAVDSMSPKYQDQLADALIAAEIDIGWSAELRLERAFSPRRSRKLAQSGCVSALFGMESGCQRILDLMDKGTKVERMAESMKNLTNAGIAVQLMTFSGFPTESVAEKAETLRFLQRNSEYWANGGMGHFILLAGSIVDRNPDRFDLQPLKTEDVDINIVRSFKVRADGEEVMENEMSSGTHGTASSDSDNQIFPRTFLRPWAGGGDCLHSMIYYQAHGYRFFKDNQLPEPQLKEVPKSYEELLRCTIRLLGQLSESPFDMIVMIQNTQKLAEHERALQRIPREPTLRAFEEWAVTVLPLPRGENQRYWLQTTEKTIEVPKLVYKLVGLGSAHNVPIGELCAELPRDVLHHLLPYLRKLSQAGFLEFVMPAAA